MTRPPYLRKHESPFPDQPHKDILDPIPAPSASNFYVVRLTAPEFTTICPVTGQPDFAHIIIDYIPDKFLVESKSFKLYLGSFRSYGIFHETCIITIAQDLIDVLTPIWLRIGGYWFPRGGIPIDVFWQNKEVPQNVWVPKHNITPYRGR